MFSNFFSPKKSYRIYNNVKKYRRPRLATDDNMAHAHCILGN